MTFGCQKPPKIRLLLPKIATFGRKCFIFGGFWPPKMFWILVVVRNRFADEFHPRRIAWTIFVEWDRILGWCKLNRKGYDFSFLSIYTITTSKTETVCDLGGRFHVGFSIVRIGFTNKFHIILFRRFPLTEIEF